MGVAQEMRQDVGYGKQAENQAGRGLAQQLSPLAAVQF
jgi:hypothetical protein